MYKIAAFPVFQQAVEDYKGKHRLRDRQDAGNDTGIMPPGNGNAALLPPDIDSNLGFPD
jgi:hypothetical protein